MSKKVTKGRSQKYWIVIFIVLVVLLLVLGLYTFLENSNQQVDNKAIAILNSSSVDQSINSSATDVPLEKYENSDYNFSIEYLNSWQSQTSSSGSGNSKIFSVGFSKESQEVSISVMSDDMESLVRNSISIEKESPMDINGLTATKLEGGSAKDGSLVNIVIIINNGQLYSIRGIGPEFNQIVSSFKLL